MNYRLLTPEDIIQEGDEFEDCGEWRPMFKMGADDLDWMFGNKWNPDSDPRVRRSITPDLTEGLQEAWQIINVLHLNAMDQGDSWPRALEWLEKWEEFKPETNAEKHEKELALIQEGG